MHNAKQAGSACLFFNFMQALFPHGLLAVVKQRASRKSSSVLHQATLLATATTITTTRDKGYNKRQRRKTNADDAAVATKNANRKASRKRDERKNETREKEETPSAPIKIPPPLQHAALLALLVRSQVAPAVVVSLTAFFKSAPWLFVALTPALELRSFVYFECFYMHLK